MIKLITEITTKTLIDFFTFGFIYSFLYFAFSTIVSIFATIFSYRSIMEILKVRIKDFKLFTKQLYNTDTSPQSSDTLRGLFIFVLGIFLMLMNFALNDGIPRMYAIFSTLLGIYFTKLLFDSYLGKRMRYLFYQSIFLIVFVILFPMRLVYRIISQKRS